jgi:hypothetical protein
MMKRIVFGAAMAGALMLWTGLGSLAHVQTAPSSGPQTGVSVADATSIAADATSAVTTCETAQVADAQALEGQAVTAGKDPEAAKELAHETVGTVKEIAADARDAISSALADVTEPADVDEEDAAAGSAPTADQFRAQVNAIATAACDAMAKVVTEAKAEISGLESAQAQQSEDNDDQVADTEDDHGQASQTGKRAEQPETADSGQHESSDQHESSGQHESD